MLGRWFATAFVAITRAAPASTAPNVFIENLYRRSSESSVYQPITCAFNEYVDLGDSYAAGINADPNGQLPLCNGTGVSPYGAGANCTTGTCARNTDAYGYQFFQDHQPKDFTFLACSGDDTDECATLQIPNIPSNADLITINIGGNNGNAFSTVVTRCVYLRTEHLSLCPGALTKAANVVANIDSALNDLFGKVKSAAPSAQVFVMSYVQFWPSDDEPGQCQSSSLSRPSADQKASMNSLVLGMNQKLEKAANATGFTFVDVDGLFEGHRLCDLGDTYIQWSLIGTPGIGDGIGDGDEDGVDDPRLDLFNYGVFHPFKTGHDQYRTALEKAVGC